METSKIAEEIQERKYEVSHNERLFRKIGYVEAKQSNF